MDRATRQIGCGCHDYALVTSLNMAALHIYLLPVYLNEQEYWQVIFRKEISEKFVHFLVKNEFLFCYPLS
jgi:hypothetical protein